MAPEMKHKTKSKKNIKKTFYEVDAPLTETKIELYAASPEDLDNKTIKLDLSKNLKGKCLEFKVRIKLKDKTLTAFPESIRLIPSYVQRIMRRGTDYVEDSFTAECRDVLIKIKPLLITRKRVSRAILKSLRENARKNIQTYVKTRTGKEILEEIITNKFQKQLLPKLKKIYPLALCEIRVFEIIKSLEKNSNTNSLI